MIVCRSKRKWWRIDFLPMTANQKLNTSTFVLNGLYSGKVSLLEHIWERANSLSCFNH